MQNLFIGLAARKKNYTSTEQSSLDVMVAKQARSVKEHNEVSTTKYPPASKEWINSVYSFNPNYIKPLTMVDIMVNRLIKSYFNFTKLIWKKKYKFSAHALKKKFRLIKRRKRAETKKNKLSLNKVFVSNGEMKHTNNKVIATFYIFNKTKKFILYKLKILSAERETILLSGEESALKYNNTQSGKKASVGFVSSLVSPTTSMAQPVNKVGKKEPASFKPVQGMPEKVTISPYTNKKGKQYGEKVFNFSSLRTMKNNKPNKVYVKPAIHENKPKYTNITNLNFAEKQTRTPKNSKNFFLGLNSYYNHINLANMTKKRLSIFISKFDNIDIKNKYITLMKGLYSGLGKYKLYKKDSLLNNKHNEQNVVYNANIINTQNDVFNQNSVHLSTFYKLLNKNNFLNLSRYSKNLTPNFFFVEKKNNALNKILLLSLKKQKLNVFDARLNNRKMEQILKAFYKSFALYNVDSTRHNINTTFKDLHHSSVAPLNSKLYVNKTSNTIQNITKKEGYLLNTISKHTSIAKKKNDSFFMSLNQTPLSVLSLASEDKNINKIKVMKLKTIRLINKIRRYKKFIVKSLSLELNKINRNDFNKRFISYERNCIRNFIKKTYRKELLNIRYAKMLLFNNNKYKIPNLLSLSNVVSKLYNKKVEFNFINLKYLYLNSDIFSRSIVARLRNRQNRLLTVLNKAVLLVNIPSINNKWEYTPSQTDRTLNKKNSSIFSYLAPENKTFNGFAAKTLSSFILHIYKNNDNLNLILKNLYLKNTPCSIQSENLSKIQRNALQSVNNKSMLGVRLEAGGRLTKRLTASRSVSKLKYRGSIKNFNSSNYGFSSVILKGNLRSNLQYTKISSKTRNGSFGLKGWVSAY